MCEDLADLTLNPDRDYQPLGRPPGPQPRKTPTARPQIEVRTVSDVLRHHIGADDGIRTRDPHLGKVMVWSVGSAMPR